MAMEHTVLADRRSFMKVAIGLTSTPMLTWATPLELQSSSRDALKTSNSNRLPDHHEALILSGRALSSNNSPARNQIISINGSGAKIATDADGRFFLETTTASFKSSDLRTTSHLLTQDMSGNWRMYLEIKI